MSMSKVLKTAAFTSGLFFAASVATISITGGFAAYSMANILVGCMALSFVLSAVAIIAPQLPRPQGFIFHNNSIYTTPNYTNHHHHTHAAHAAHKVPVHPQSSHKHKTVFFREPIATRFAPRKAAGPEVKYKRVILGNNDIRDQASGVHSAYKVQNSSEVKHTSSVPGILKVADAARPKSTRKVRFNSHLNKQF